MMNRERLERLEREAEAGDPRAQEELARLKLRTGVASLPSRLKGPGDYFKAHRAGQYPRAHWTWASWAQWVEPDGQIRVRFRKRRATDLSFTWSGQVEVLGETWYEAVNNLFETPRDVGLVSVEMCEKLVQAGWTRFDGPYNVWKSPEGSRVARWRSRNGRRSGFCNPTPCKVWAWFGPGPPPAMDKYGRMGVGWRIQSDWHWAYSHEEAFVGAWKDIGLSDEL